MTKINIIIAVAIAAVTISVWAWVNRPDTEPPWPKVIQGFSFQPLRAHHDPVKAIWPSVEEIDSDLSLLAGTTHAVRTYTVGNTLGEIPALARKHGINVALGAWISADLRANELEIERLITIAQKQRRNVVRVIVGNEAILRREISTRQLIAYLDKVRQLSMLYRDMYA